MNWRERPADSPPILVVEGDPDLCDLLRLALESAGHRVVTAASHAEALDCLRACRVALILTDSEARFPGDPHRWEGLMRLRAASGGVPVILCTTHPPAAFNDWAERGFADLLPMPFDLDVLLANVRARIASS